MYSPSSSVITVRDSPVLGLVTVTATPGMAAPVGSVARPKMVPVVWAHPGWAMPSNKSSIGRHSHGTLHERQRFVM